MLNNSFCTTYFIRFYQLTCNLNPYALEFRVCVEAQQAQFSDYLYDRNVNQYDKGHKQIFSSISYLHSSIPLFLYSFC
jgi:hypothetical protein